MLSVHEGQFIGLAIAIIGGGGMCLWHYIDGLKEEAARAHEQAARAEEKIAELNGHRSPSVYREDKKEWLDENKEHLRAEMKDLDSEELRKKCEGMLVSALYWEDMFNWAHGEHRKAEQTLESVGKIVDDAGYPDKDELPF